MLYFSGERVQGAEIILRFVAKKRGDVAECGEADAEHGWIFRREDDLIQQLRIEASFQANLRRVGCTGERVGRAAFGPCPLAAGDGRIHGHHAVHGLAFNGGERGFLRIQIGRLVRQRTRLHEDRLRIRATAVDDTPEHLATNWCAVGVPGERYDHEILAHLIVRRLPRVVALPAAAQAHIADVALGGNNRHPTAAIGHVMPHQAAHL